MTPPAHSLPRRLVRYLWREWVRPLALPLLAVAAAKSALADINVVPTGSMKPTILEGDVVFVNKLAYDLRVPFTFARVARWADPARGDIVVCFSPEDGQRLVKRVIGLPGDRLELRANQLMLNGAQVPSGSLDAGALRDVSPADRAAAVFAQEQVGDRPHAFMTLAGRPALRSFGPLTVPAGHYFMLGDNRDNSHDSRFYGAVPRQQIIGEAIGVFVSADPARWLRPRPRRFFTTLQ